jgi:Zn-finger nucleic acid-binding protein
VPPRDEQSCPSSGCPRCGWALAAIAIERGTFVFACAGCRGVLVPPRAWARLGERPELARALDTRAPASAPPRLALLGCPVCRVEMERGCFAATSEIVIDVCARGHGLWLDAGELPAALAYADHRAQVGVVATRQEAERNWDRAVLRAPHVQMAIALESSKIKADSAQRMWRAKRAALGMGAAFFAIRLLIGVWHAHERHAHPPVDVTPVDSIVSTR